VRDDRTDVASSDATNIRSHRGAAGDDYVINGRVVDHQRGDPRCHIAIFGQIEPRRGPAPTAVGASFVPMETPGVTFATCCSSSAG
jgi:hypothetical protein